MNFAGIGRVISHEMNHGFDNNGRKYDKNGNCFNLWDSKSEEEFSKKAKCFVDQYSSYKVKGVDLNVN